MDSGYLTKFVDMFIFVVFAAMIVGGAVMAFWQIWAAQ